MRTETVKVYKYDELSKEAKERAIEDVRDNEGYLDYEWFNYLHEDFIEELNTIGVDCERFYWGLGYSGKEFTAQNISVIDEQELLKSAGLTKWSIINELREEKTEIQNIGLDGHGEAEVEIDFENEDNLSDKEYADRDKEVDELNEKITELLKEKFDKFWRRINEDYDYFMSDEGITEHLKMNEYEFNRDGTRW